MAGNKETSLPVKISPKVHLALKKYVIDRGTTMTAFATAAILKAMGRPS